MSKTASTGDINKPFLTDVQTLRDRARNHLETGNVTQSYKGDVIQAIAILQSATVPIRPSSRVLASRATPGPDSATGGRSLS